MAKLGINTGSTPDAGDGDSLLVGAIKINSNFDELYNVLGDGTNISNTIGYASTSGISTLSQGLSGTPNITVGIVTASFVNVTGSGTSTTQLRVTGVSTLSTTNISGDLTFTGSNDIYLKDNGVANFGNSNDLQIYHNGSFSVIKDDGTGGLVVYSDGVGIGTENITNTLTVAGSGTSTSQLYVAGISTLNGITVAGSGTSTSQLYVAGISTLNGITVQSPGSENIYIGDSAGLLRGSSDSSNVAIGYQAARNSDGMDRNVTIGTRAGENVQSNWNTIIGYEAGKSNSGTPLSGAHNTLIGYQAGLLMEGSSFQNTFVGSTAGDEITSGDSNTILGRFNGNQNGLDIRTSSNNIVLSDGDGNVRLYANPSGNVGVGTTNPTSALTVVGSGTSTSQLYVTGVSTFVGIPRFDDGISFSDDSSGLPTAATRNIDVSLGFTKRFIFRTNKVEFFSFSDYYGGFDHFIFEISKTGDVTAAGNLSVSGIATASSFSGSGAGLTSIPAAQLTGALPAIDGSALINVTASGTGIIIADDGTPVGTAGTIDFGTGIIVSPVSAGIVTVTSTGGGGGESYWVSTNVGIHTLSSVGVGTTNPTSALTVVGSGTSTSQLYVTGVSTFGAQVNVNTGGLSNLNIGFPNDLYLQWDESSQSASLDTSATGNLYVQNIANGGIFLNAGVSNKSGVHLYPSDRVELLHAGSKKFETLGTGVTVTGTTFTNQLSVSGIATINGLTIQTGSGTFTATAGIGYTADSYAVSDFVNAEYTLFFQHSTGIQSQKVLVMDDGTTAYSQEYGIMSSNDLLVSVGATVNSGNVELWWTPETGISGIVTYRYTRETMI